MVEFGQVEGDEDTVSAEENGKYKYSLGRENKNILQDTEMIITRVEIPSSIGKCGLGLINKYFERQKTLCLIWRQSAEGRDQ